MAPRSRKPADERIQWVGSWAFFAVHGETSRAFQLVLAVLGCTAAQKGPLWWAGHHREHHRFSDTPQDVVHSPVQRGFWCEGCASGSLALSLGGSRSARP